MDFLRINPNAETPRKAAWFQLGFEGGPQKGGRDLLELGKDSGLAVCATVKPLGKRLGLLRYSEPDRYERQLVPLSFARAKLKRTS